MSSSGSRIKLAHYIRPMLATLHDKAFDDPDWIFEVKWDGYRAIAEVTKKDIKLYSRNGLSFINQYPPVAKAVEKLRLDIILDGEIVVLDKHHKPSFQKLQQFADNRSLPILYYVFDCLFFEKKSMLHIPLAERKKLLRSVLPENEIVRYSDHVTETGKEFFRKAAEMDLEGMMAKRAGSLYVPGKRSTEWLKIKNHNIQEAIIAGFTAPRGSRKHFGALILALYEGKDLHYIGHTGTGFTESLLDELYKQMRPLQTARSPFPEKIPVNAPVTWIKPALVCAIKYSEVTDSGILRHPVFWGLRLDKSAREVTKEKVVHE